MHIVQSIQKNLGFGILKKMDGLYLYLYIVWKKLSTLQIKTKGELFGFSRQGKMIFI
jgi:hypothetical protein